MKLGDSLKARWRRALYMFLNSSAEKYHRTMLKSTQKTYSGTQNTLVTLICWPTSGKVEKEKARDALTPRDAKNWSFQGVSEPNRVNS